MEHSENILKLTDFEDLVGNTFVFSLEGVEQKLEGVLSRAKALAPNGFPDALRDPFRLEFRFAPDANLGQCVFQVESPSGEALPPMLLVPRAGGEDGWIMDADFN